MQLKSSDDAAIVLFRQRVALFFVGLAICALLFVASRPYEGVRHDAILYAAQALRSLHPQVFGADLFFRFGSQDSFSLFGPLYGSAVRAWGLEPANLILVLLSQSLFLATAAALACALLPTGWRLAGLMLLALSSGGYGGLSSLHVAEPFVTARPFAEAVTLIALTLRVRGHRIASLATLFVAASLHPLMALPGFIVWWLLAVHEDRRYLLAIVGAVVALVLAMSEIEPFTQLLRVHDDQWRELISLQNPMIFLREWHLFDGVVLVTDLGLAWVIRRELKRRIRGLFDAAVLACVVGVLVTALGADLLSNVLVTSLQTWRAHWLLTVLVALLLPPTLSRWAAQGPAGWLVAGLLMYAFLQRGQITGLLGLMLGIGVMCNLHRPAFVLNARLSIVALIALAVAIVVTWSSVVGWTVATHQLVPTDSHSVKDLLLQVLRIPPVGPLIICLPVLVLSWLLRRSTVALLTVAIGTVAFAAGIWDQRSGWARMLEKQADGYHPFVAWISPNDEVFWEGDPDVPWLLMHRRSYYSDYQLAGQMFNRATAVEGLRRQSVMELFEHQRQICQLMNRLNKKFDACLPDISTLQTACEADENLRFIVTGSNIDGTWIAQWTPPFKKDPQVPSYYLYSCDRLILGASRARQD